MQFLKQAQNFCNYSKLEIGVGVAIVLIIIAAIPGLPIAPFKVFFLALIALAFSSLILFHIIQARSITVPRSPLYLPLLGLTLAYLISALFQGASHHTLIGFLSLDSFGGMLILALLSFCFLLLSTRMKSASVFTRSLVAGVAFAGALQIILLILTTLELPLGRFFANIPSITGGWNDLSILSAGALIVVMFSGKDREALKGVLTGVLLAVLVITNFLLSWQLLAIAGFASLIYSVSSTRGESLRTNVSFLSVLVLALSLVSILSGGRIGSSVQNALNITFIEARPSLETTIDLADHVLKTSPIVGAGPGNFASVWDLEKPREVNETQFWMQQFNSGSGYIPTILISAGALGLLAFIFLVVSLVSALWKSRKTGSAPDSSQNGLYALAGFLFIVCLVYNPGPVVIALFFISVGILGGIAALSAKQTTFAWKEENNMLIPLAAVSIVFIAFLAGTYLYSKSFASLAYFAQAQTSEDITQAEQKILTAIELAGYPSYFEALGSLYANRLSTLASDQALSDAEKSQAAVTLIQANIQASRMVVDYDENNYLGWLFLARSYTNAESLGVEGAREEASAALDKAQALSPLSPIVALERARLFVVINNTQEARFWINEAFLRKNNYTEAALLLSQLEIADGKAEQAKALIEQAALLERNNPTLYFQLGLLNYSTESYDSAARAFMRALEINPSYANARYFFALALANLGERELALENLAMLQESNPDNEELDLIISNLRSGKGPFDGAQPPLDVAPQAREDLPLEE